MKPVRIRPRADAEIDALADYIAADSPSAALRFLDATQKAFELISEQPEIGSKRYAKPPVLQGLRMCPVPDFPATHLSRDNDVAIESPDERDGNGLPYPCILPTMTKKLYDSSHTGDRPGHFRWNRRQGQTKPAHIGKVGWPLEKQRPPASAGTDAQEPAS